MHILWKNDSPKNNQSVKNIQIRKEKSEVVNTKETNPSKEKNVKKFFYTRIIENLSQKDQNQWYS